MKRYIPLTIAVTLAVSACAPTPPDPLMLAYQQEAHTGHVGLRLQAPKPRRSSLWTCHTGPRGGRYHYSASGNKVYSGC
jgi:hypothetical protein